MLGEIFGWDFLGRWITRPRPPRRGKGHPQPRPAGLPHLARLPASPSLLHNLTLAHPDSLPACPSMPDRPAMRQNGFKRPAGKQALGD